MRRSDITEAPYNPRVIGDEEKKRLKQAIRKHGLVEPLVYNKRTGHLVSGHQRLSILDSLEQSQDYELLVSVIDVDERTEAELNVQLNNPSMQGSWDFDLLADMSDEFGISMEDFGFSEFDVDYMFGGDDRFSQLFDNPRTEFTKEQIEEVRNAREQGRELMNEKNTITFYTVIVFKDDDERSRFHAKIGVPVYEQYVTSEQFSRLLKDD